LCRLEVLERESTRQPHHQLVAVTDAVGLREDVLRDLQRVRDGVDRNGPKTAVLPGILHHEERRDGHDAERHIGQSRGLRRVQLAREKQREPGTPGPEYGRSYNTAAAHARDGEGLALIQASMRARG